MEEVQEKKGGVSSRSQTSLVFGVNGEKFELVNVDPSTTLLEFLRSQTRFKSVKLGCGEGMPCVVSISTSTILFLNRINYLLFMFTSIRMDKLFCVV